MAQKMITPASHGTASEYVVGTTLRKAIHARRRESGAFAIMTAPLLIVLIAFSALAIELGMVYNRIVDLHGLAKAVALAAASELNGTTAGIAAAQAIARTTAERMRYRYFTAGAAFTWKDSALTFGADYSRSGTWVDGGTANGQAATMFYAKVDTTSLDASSTVATIFARILSSSLSTIRVNESAIAGRTAINVMPLAICAMGAKTGTRSHTPPTGPGPVLELVQYGFRRGVSYDLMQLNPNGQLPVRYAVNPVVAPGRPSTPFSLPSLSRFVCTGTMWVPRVTGGRISVSQLPTASPLADFFLPLNSRFDRYTGGPCDPSGAPPDYNIRSFAYDQANTVRWMSPGIGSPAATPVPKPTRLETVADLATPTGPASAYGPLWAYAKAVKAPNPPSAPEPSRGYTEFTTADWPMLYKIGPTAPGYPTTTSTPYLATSNVNGNYLAARAANVDISTYHRRVLNIPLLACSPSPTGANAPATVEGIGKFFMTVPATSDALIAEFAGLASEESLVRKVELFP